MVYLLMPYGTIEDLPDNLRHLLPPNAQKVFIKAFNRAYKDSNLEKTAFQVAWSSVKKAGYRKNKEGKWRLH